MDSMYISKPGRLWKNKADFFSAFRIAARDSHADLRPMVSESDLKTQDEHGLRDLNISLATLVEVFPDVEPAIFRDMLVSLSPESRVEVVTEQILRKKSNPTPIRRSLLSSIISKPQPLDDYPTRKPQPLQVEETFRGDRYHDAVKTLLYQEFGKLSHSSIRAVMAENNGSYTRSRPVLQLLSTRTWRFTISNLWSKKTNVTDLASHPALNWRTEGDQSLPSVIPTSSPLLNLELHDLLVLPILEKSRQEVLVADQTLAVKLNTAEAEQHDALFDCDCCFSSVTFEEVVSCGEHILCHDCIRRTTNEALWGQGWARTIDLNKATIRCFAPATTECQACISQHSLQQALTTDLSNLQVWQDLQDRISSECLLKSRIQLERCPKCDYAEANELPSLRTRNWNETISYCTAQLRRHVLQPQLLAVIATLYSGLLVGLESLGYVLLAPFWLIWHGVALYLSLFHRYVHPINMPVLLQYTGDEISRTLSESLSRLHKQRRGLKFRCQRLSCMQISCLRCRTAWHDPHICFEDEKTSLRTAIEASATAVVKRTCPRCMLSFVKSSGCNKLVCNCGYTMCYICRAEISHKEGYAHFCQHFRPSGGRCRECERCDLYGDIDEETTIRQAAVVAEQEWRQKEAIKNKVQLHEAQSETSDAMIEAVLGRDRHSRWYETLLDRWLDARIVFVEDTQSSLASYAIPEHI